MPIERIAASLIVVVVLVFGATYGQGQPPAQLRAGGKRAEEAAQVEQPKQFRGRLPDYYGEVVDERQREQIYAIQRQYFLTIEGLKAQLDAVIGKRDTEVAAVLSPQQLAEVKRLEAEARAKRAAKKKMEKAAAR